VASLEFENDGDGWTINEFVGMDDLKDGEEEVSQNDDVSPEGETDEVPEIEVPKK